MGGDVRVRRDGGDCRRVDGLRAMTTEGRRGATENARKQHGGFMIGRPGRPVTAAVLAPSLRKPMQHVLSNVRLTGWGRTRFRCHMCGAVGGYMALTATDCTNTLGVEPGDFNRRLWYGHRELLAHGVV